MGFVYFGTHGTEDPTRAALPFISALGAKKIDDDVSVVLLGDAAVLIREEVHSSVLPVGFPPLRDIVIACREAGIAFYV